MPLPILPALYVVEVTDLSLSSSTTIQWYRGREPHLTFAVDQIIYFGPPAVSIPNKIMTISHSRHEAAMRRGYVYTTHVGIQPLTGVLSGRKKGS